MRRSSFPPPSSPSHLAALTRRLLYQQRQPHPQFLNSVFEAATRFLLPGPREWLGSEEREPLVAVLSTVEPLLQPKHDPEYLIRSYSYAATFADPSHHHTISTILQSSPHFRGTVELASITALAQILLADPQGAIHHLDAEAARLSRQSVPFRLLKFGFLGIVGVEAFRLAFFLGASIAFNDPAAAMASDGLTAFLLSPDYAYASTITLYSTALVSYLSYNALVARFPGPPPSPRISREPFFGAGLSVHRRAPSPAFSDRTTLLNWMIERAGLDTARFWNSIPALPPAVLAIIPMAKEAKGSVDPASRTRAYFLHSVLLGLCRYGDTPAVLSLHRALSHAHIPIGGAAQLEVATYLKNN